MPEGADVKTEKSKVNNLSSRDTRDKQFKSIIKCKKIHRFKIVSEYHMDVYRIEPRHVRIDLAIVLKTGIIIIHTSMFNSHSKRNQ